MSGYLYFPNNLKDIKDHIQAYMIICKIFLQLKVTVFKENLNLQLPLIFYSSAVFIFETVFISEQIAENSIGALQEIFHQNKFITSLNVNVFSYMILQFKLSLENFIIILYDFKNTVARQFYFEKPQFVPQKLEMKLKHVKIKHSVSSPLKSKGRPFFS